MPITNKALNFLRSQQELKNYTNKQDPIREFRPNEKGFYSMQQCYILNKMIEKGAVIESNGLFDYTPTNKTTPNHYKINVTIYNMSIEYYNKLRELGVKNCIELLEWSEDQIQVVQKISGSYMITTITGDGMTSKPYQKEIEKITFKQI